MERSDKVTTTHRMTAEATHAEREPSGSTPPPAEHAESADAFPPPWSLWEAAVVVGILFALSLLDKSLALPEVRAALRVEVPALRLAYVLLFQGLPFLVLWLLWRRKHVGFRAGFGFAPVDPAEIARGVWRGGLVIIAVNAVYYSVVGALGVRPFGPWEETSRRLVQTFEGGPLAVALLFLGAAVIAPLAEEMTFRGVTQSALAERFGPKVAIPVTAAVFGAAHIDPYRFLPLAVTGLVLGTLAWGRRSVTASLAMHATVNAVALALTYVAYLLGAA